MFFQSGYFGFIRKNSGTARLTNKTKAAGLGVDTADSYKLKFNKNGTVVTLLDDGGSGVQGGSSSTEVVTATNVILAAESGKTFFLNSAVEFASTLPAVAAGLKFTFIVAAAPSGASYTVAAASGTPIHGMVLSKDLNGATDSGATAGTGVLTLTFVDGKAQKGDKAVFECDGTDWYVTAFTGGNFDAITLS